MMRRQALLSALLLCTAGAGCAGEDPELLELQAYLQTRGAAAPGEATRARLNATFTRQSVRAAAYGDAELEGERWSPVVSESEEQVRAADVSAWLRSGVIGADGAFRPSDSCGAASSALELVPAAQAALPALDRRVAALECALAEVSGRRIEVIWAEGAEHAIALDEEARAARVNPRLLELTAPELRNAPAIDAPAATALPESTLDGPHDEPALPHEREHGKGADGLGALVGLIAEPLLWLLLLPARLLLFCCTCEWPDFTQAGRAAPLPILQNLLTLVPAAIAWALGKRKRR